MPDTFKFDETSLEPLDKLRARGYEFEEIKLPGRTLLIPNKKSEGEKCLTRCKSSTT